MTVGGFVACMQDKMLFGFSEKSVHVIFKLMRTVSTNMWAFRRFIITDLYHRWWNFFWEIYIFLCQLRRVIMWKLFVDNVSNYVINVLAIIQIYCSNNSLLLLKTVLLLRNSRNLYVRNVRIFGKRSFYRLSLWQKGPTQMYFQIIFWYLAFICISSSLWYV